MYFKCRHTSRRLRGLYPVENFLEMGQEARLELNRLERRVEDLTIRASRYPRSGDEDTVHAVLTNEIIETLSEIKYYHDIYESVEYLISQVSSPEYRELLQSSYIEGRTNVQGYMQFLEKFGIFISERQVHRYLRAAVLEAQRVFYSLHTDERDDIEIEEDEL